MLYFVSNFREITSLNNVNIQVPWVVCVYVGKEVYNVAESMSVSILAILV